MLMSQLFAPTLREVPADAEISSHQLMLRAGMMRRVASGIFTFLPLGQRVIAKVEAIIREEMNRKGGQEVGLPIIQPAEPWLETKRWMEYGPEMFKLKDRHGRDFCLGPTHEEIITVLVRSEVTSYKQLPLLLYQIQNKYRDEIRPRFGVMRAREFIMKDLYSFDVDEDGLNESYAKMYDAYSRIFTRCGLVYRVVEADPGAIGGSTSHEFTALANYGETEIVFCGSCDYAASVEKAEVSEQRIDGEAAEPPRTLEEVSTPGVRSIEQLCDCLSVKPERTIKTLIYKALKPDGGRQLVAAVLRGDHAVNEAKLKNVLGALTVEMGSPDEVAEELGVPVGSAGPVNIKKRRPDVVLAVDKAVPHVVNAVAGANHEGRHLVNVNYGRDFAADLLADLRLAKAQDPCPRCAGGTLHSSRGIEVGQIFKLGTKYSQVLGATYADVSGQQRPIVMGCYGIGVTRTVAAVIEQHHDERGIIWPLEIAPYHVVIVPVNQNDPDQRRVASDLYRDLEQAGAGVGLDVLLDDRDERAGVKFADADLMGFPYRVTVGPKALARGMVELTDRSTGKSQLFTQRGVVEALVGRMALLKKGRC